MQTDSLPVDVPVVVVTGLPRSGTSMMMRMLEAGGLPVLTDGLRRADADNPNGYYEFEPVKRLAQDASWVSGARGKAVKMVYLLLHHLPASTRYKVIFMRRHLEEVVASQDAMLRRQGAAVTPAESRRLIRLFRDQLRAADDWLAAHDNFQVLSTDYNQTLNDPRTTCARIKSFLGLDLDETLMGAVVAPALYRQRVAGPGDST